MTKQKKINRDYKTVLFDFDGTLFDTTEANQYVARQKTLRRFSPEWVQARNEYLEHIKQCPYIYSRAELKKMSDETSPL